MVVVGELWKDVVSVLIDVRGGGEVRVWCNEIEEEGGLGVKTVVL